MKRGAPDHPKMRRLARRLGLPHMAAVGCMEMLWHWAARYAQDGAIGRYDDDDIADALYWTEPAERLITALVESGFVDRDEEHRLVLHGWSEHCEDSVHATLARARAHFADGNLPNLAKLGKEERPEAESFYAVEAPAKSGRQKSPPAAAGRQKSPPAAAGRQKSPALASASASSLPSVEKKEHAPTASPPERVPAAPSRAPEPPKREAAPAEPTRADFPPLDPSGVSAATPAPAQTSGNAVRSADRQPTLPSVQTDRRSASRIDPAQPDARDHATRSGNVGSLALAAPRQASSGSRTRPRTRAPDALSRDQRNEIARWVLASEDAAIRAQLGSLDAQIDACLDWHRAKGSLHADWVATVRTWMRRAPEFSAQQRAATSRRESFAEREERARQASFDASVAALEAIKLEREQREADRIARLAHGAIAH